MRIASLSPAATEILCALGLNDQIICTDKFSDFPEGAKGIPKLSGHQQIDAEALRAFAPEIVLTGTVVQERLAEELRTAGFTVIHQDPRTLAQVEEGIRALGALFDRSLEAEALLLAMRRDFNGTDRKAKLLPRRARVYVEEWLSPPMVSGNWVPEVVRIAGGEPMPLARGALSRDVTLQEVSAFDPDLLLISWCGAGTTADPAVLQRRAGWGVLRAVRGGSVRVIDDSLLNRPGPRLAEGARRIYGWLFEILH